MEKNSEVLIFKADNLTAANAFRSALIDKFSGCWFYVFSPSNEVWAANEFGGCLDDETVDNLRAYCYNVLDKPVKRPAKKRAHEW